MVTFSICIICCLAVLQNRQCVDVIVLVDYTFSSFCSPRQKKNFDNQSCPYDINNVMDKVILCKEMYLFWMYLYLVLKYLQWSILKCTVLLTIPLMLFQWQLKIWKNTMSNNVQDVISLCFLWNRCACQVREDTNYF